MFLRKIKLTNRKWFSVFCTLIDYNIHHHSGQNVVDSQGAATAMMNIIVSAGNNFSSFTGHMSFQIFLLVGHLTNWTGHNLLTDNTLKKRTQDMLVRCLVIVSDHNVKLAGHFQNLVGQCPMSDCYFQHCIVDKSTDNAEPLSICSVPQYSMPKKVFFSECDKNHDTKKKQAMSVISLQYDWFISQNEHCHCKYFN